MTERPILFSGPMIQAILAGRKTMTRRVIKPQPHAGIRATPFHPSGIEDGHSRQVKRKFYLGDRLYVKEATWIWCEKRKNGITATGRPKYRYVPVGQHVVYCADSPKPNNRVDDNPAHGWRFKTARFMPRWASRINLEVTEVRVERLRSISEEDAEAEGVTAEPDWTAAMKFAVLWDHINGKTFPWESNPFVWVVGFRRVA